MTRRKFSRCISVFLILHIITSVYFFTRAIRSPVNTDAEVDFIPHEDTNNMENIPTVMERSKIYIEENDRFDKLKTGNHHKGRVIKMAKKSKQNIPIFLTTTKSSTYHERATKANGENFQKGFSDKKMGVLNNSGTKLATSLKDAIANLPKWRETMNQSLNEWTKDILNDLEYGNETASLPKQISNRSFIAEASETNEDLWKRQRAVLPEKVNSIQSKKSSLEDDKIPRKIYPTFDKLATTNFLPTYNLNFKHVSDGMLVYAVYLDERKADRFLRIVLLSKKEETEKNMLCKFAINDTFQITVDSKVTFYETCESHMKPFSSFIASCQVPKQNISLDEVILRRNDKRQLDIHMNIINNKRPNKDVKTFGVCIPPLFGSISVLRLTEFIEFYRILGAEHFVFYTNHVSPAITLLLDYYKSMDIVTVMPWNLTIHKKDIWNHGQSASVWDCLYRTMFKFQHVAFIDIDEFIIPRNQKTIPEFLSYLHKVENVNNYLISGYKFFSAFFDSSFPGDKRVKSLEIQQFVTLNSTIRTHRFSKVRTKLIVNPENIFELGIHHISKPNEEHFEVYTVSPDVAFIHHYRTCDTMYGTNCRLRMNDDRALKYQTVLVNEVKTSLYRVRDFKRKISKHIST